MGWGNGIGIGWATKRIDRYVSGLISAFKARVLADGGVFEAEPCLVTILDSLQSKGLLKKASLVVTPNAYKANILYDVLPNTTLGDLSVVRATTATRVNSAGLIESVANNIPRLDYTNSTCPSILVEPQRTNLLLRSQEFDNIYWVKTDTSITANNVVAPDGTLTADTMVISASTSRILPTTITGSGTYTVSCYVKRLTGTANFQFRLVTDGANQIQNFTLTNDWTKLTFTVTAITSITQVQFRSGGGTGNIAIWGAQLEAGANATSYIKTEATTVTRNADVINKTGISSLIGQTEGTIFADVNIKRIGIPTRQISNLTSGTANFLGLAFLNTNVLRVTIRANAGTQYNVSTSALPIGRYKLAGTYKAGELKLYVNGVLIGTNTNASVSWSAALDRLNLDNSVLATDNFSDDINLVSHWKTVLTNEECINLTTI
jgi:hypothetical protein